MPNLLEQVDFRHPARAREDLARLGTGIPERILTRIRMLLASVPDPDEALHHLERLRADSPAAFDRISSSPAVLRYLIATFSYSRFLSEAVLRRPEGLLQVVNAGDMHRVLNVEEYGERLLEFLGPECPGVPPALTFARFRRRQILRIMLRDVLGLATLSDVTEELSNLADAVLDLAYSRIRESLVARYGEPRDESGRVASFCVISLGKLGGKELNYSSDIDLMFLYSGNGETSGPHRITNKEFFKKAANQYTELLSTYTPEGLGYRVDLRLRPDGRLGEVCISLDGARAYYESRARDWEKQMLIKARVSAGDRELGRALLEFVEPLIYSSSLDFRAVESVSETRERIGERLAARRPADAGVDVKLAPGGIRDIEFLVQCLQRLHGGREPWVRHGSTLFALFRLRDKGLLSSTEYARLASAYQFLRHLEHRLQFDEDRQTHALPTDPEELALLARKMPPLAAGETATAETLRRQLEDHVTEVRDIYERVIHSQKPMYYTLPEPSPAGAEPPVELPPPGGLVGSANLARFLDQRAPGLAACLSRVRLHRGRERFEYFLERVFDRPEWLARLDADSRLAECCLDLFEHSHYFADQLLRDPELLQDLEAAEPIASESLEDSMALRRFFRRRMLRIQSESIFRSAPIFETLGRTSALADSVVAAAYRIALAQARPPADSAYVPASQMMVIALGRLGMREFDLASDADLVFVLPDAEAAASLFWTGIAEKMIQILSAYTGEGVMFAIDTRLRPNGREGDLVQTESAYKEYFAKHAEAWEGITYMKSRGVAGDLERATEFLHELQEVDWRRYGQGGRSRKELAQMRQRLEREQGARNPLKAGPGGYYDIDFALMYLRLKGAGIFYKVLNTPARIDVIEKMGHLEREDADFLRDAATFYRAIDHGLRVSTGHAEGSLPTAQAQLEVLTELVRRWTPAHLHDLPLDTQLREIRRKTREFFNRLFAC
ncbi:MAG TPA: glutamine-synthetase adenylyltransferase [Bryobacteraceae bacterium]|nr:glutamine-synthetase adenylyltransferase [Bryobacteraceae bacterium]